MDRKANLFVIGAMKSGTTSLHEYLGEHPEIFMTESRWKEPGYFVAEKTWDRGPDWYAGLFEGAKGEAYLGESSTHYTMLPLYEGVVERIRQYNPDSRFIYVLRDPVERALSHYWHLVRWDGESRTPLAAVREIPSICDFSNYAMQLQPYMDRFDPNRILVITFESLVSRRAEVLQQIFRWLNVSTEVRLAPSGGVFNATPGQIQQTRGRGWVNRFRYSAAWRALAPLVPKSLRLSGRRLAERSVEPGTADVSEAVEYLRERLAPAVDVLGEMLNRNFSEWATMNRDCVSIHRNHSFTGVHCE